MNNQLNSINSTVSPKHLYKTQKFVENTKRAVRKVLASAWIAVSTMGPMATTSVPASAHSISHMETITSSNINEVWLWTTLNLFAAFDAEPSETDTTIWENISTAEAKENNSSINSLEYRPLTITNIDPESLMPKVEVWDKNVYKHIEHLRIPEATVVTDMMWKYGAGNHSAEEYQQLMMRLNIGMIQECPQWYDYEVIWWWNGGDADLHATSERSILNTLIKHANFKVNNPNDTSRENALTEFVKNNSNSINIFWCSAYGSANTKSDYDKRLNKKSVKDLCNMNNIIIFAAGTNINSKGWHLRNKIYNGEHEADEYGRYSLVSMANSDKNTQPNSHLLVTIWTDADWDIDQTNETVESSKYPVWFKNNVLFSGRAFPIESSWKISAEWGSRNNWKYSTSYTTYSNVAIASILFQMKADTPDVDKLLEMTRTTALTDYIRFDLNGDGDTNDIYDGQPESQPLQLMNPAWFFQKYLMPTSLPTKLSINEITPLEKWYYHGVVYQIPGAEVNINGQWVPFTDDNKELIFSQNPMNLEWRLNGELLNNYNYKPWDTINGQIIAVDDQWNGLNITKDFSINIEDTSDIDSITVSHTSNSWYTIDGIRLDKKPTKPGIYIMNGQKIIIK